MNVPIARALRGLLYVLWDLSQVDPSDLSALFAGPGRLRIGFSELAPQSGSDPSDETVDDAVQKCWDNAFCNFSAPVGTSLICIQGPWSNVADAKIKSGIAAQAVRAGSTVYNPLYARASQMPQPWGVTVLCAEHTGSHPPIDVDWSLEPRVRAIVLRRRPRRSRQPGQPTSLRCSKISGTWRWQSTAPTRVRLTWRKTARTQA